LILLLLKGMFGTEFSGVVDSHTTSAKKNIKRMEDAFENNNASELEHAAHSLKGASAQFGAVTLSELAKQMEQFGKNKEIDKAKAIFSELKSARENVETEMLKEM